MNRLTLLAAAVALALSPCVAWGDVRVLADFEDESSFDFYEGGTDLGPSTDTPDPSSSFSNHFLMSPANDDGEVWTGLEWGDFFDPENTGEDLSEWTYLNFYAKAEGGTTDFWCMPGGPNWAWGVAIEPTLTTEWQYISVAVADMALWWAPDDDPANVDWTSVGRIFFAGVPDADITVFIDHVTMSDTPEEGMLGGAEGEGEGEPGPPPVPEGMPVAGMLGLGLVAAACALGGALTLRKK